jgi:hypothetical protein
LLQNRLAPWSSNCKRSRRPGIVARICQRLQDDDCFDLAAQIAFYFSLSLKRLEVQSGTIEFANPARTSRSPRETKQVAICRAILFLK